MVAGANAYAYSNDNPIHYRDLSGLDAEREELLHLADQDPIYVEGMALHEFDNLFKGAEGKQIDVLTPGQFEKWRKSEIANRSAYYTESWTEKDWARYRENPTEERRADIAESKWREYIDREYLGYLRGKAADLAESWHRYDIAAGADNEYLAFLVTGVTIGVVGPGAFAKGLAWSALYAGSTSEGGFSGCGAIAGLGGAPRPRGLAPTPGFSSIETTLSEELAGVRGGTPLGNITHPPIPTNDALRLGEAWLGTGFREIGAPGSGVFRSADGLRQFRMTTSDIIGAHGSIGGHVHFESIVNGAVVENNHIPVF